VCYAIPTVKVVRGLYDQTAQLANQPTIGITQAARFHVPPKLSTLQTTSAWTATRRALLVPGRSIINALLVKLVF
jgi:hypothetical protein